VAERFSGWLARRWSVGMRPALATALVLAVAIGALVVSRHEPEPQVSQEEVEEVRREALIAFAYVDKYTRRTGDIIRGSMIDEVVEPLEDAMNEVKIIETKPRDARSDT
jgi:hypothetical protein